MKHRWRLGMALALFAAAGCASEKAARPLPPGAFTAPPTIGTSPNSPVDRSGALPVERPLGEEVPPAPAERQKTSVKEKTPAVESISPVVQQNVQSPAERGLEIAATRPELGHFTTAPSSGQYLTLGGVVAEVNGTPIYADKVLAEIVPVLAARAPNVSREGFRAIAAQEIGKQVQDRINLEVEYAAAQRNLDEKDRQLAEALTEDWRKHKIAQGGGSVELARKLAADHGQDFDEMVQEQYRSFMSQIYYQKRIVPRIQVTVDDMRRYYNQHLATEFTRPATARFRLIKVRVQQVGDRDAAKKKIEDLRQRIVKGGEEFSAVASTVNDAALLATGGELTVQRGAFGAEKVEEAVWATPIGQLTPIIETPDAFYIAKVEDKSEMHVAPFDQEQVQGSIREKLRSEQFRVLREKELEQLREQSLIRSNHAMLDTAVDMAMENYPLWAAKS
jgi:peptidyl-prolyl cis-trans isomerase SurA